MSDEKVKVTQHNKHEKKKNPFRPISVQVGKVKVTLK